MNSYYLFFNNFFINLFSMIIFIKIMNIKEISFLGKIGFFIFNILLTAIYIVCRKYVDIVFCNFILITIQATFFSVTNWIRFSNSLVAAVISYTISYILNIFSAFAEFPIQKILYLNDTIIENIIINIMLKNIIEALLVYAICKIKKISNGINFLKRKNEFLEIAIINISIIFMLVQGLIGYNNKEVYKSLLYYYVMIGIVTVCVVYKTIVLYYKQKLTDDTIEEMKSELDEKDNEIKRLTEENFKVHKVNHEFYNKQKALEKMVRDSMNMESGEELAVLERIENVTKEHSESMKSLKSLDELPHTEIPEIDDMFSYMRQECVDSNIEFALRVRGNVFYMINNLIAKEKLETMIGDHIRDAIIAVNSSDNKNKKILVSIGKESSIYELCIFDTGIEFEIDTLNRLGLEQVTTHKEEGGTGIGFISTFETMRESKASLEIEEIGKICSDNYTKAVKIIFDGKNEYRIKSYRKDELNGVLNSNRIKLL